MSRYSVIDVSKHNGVIDWDTTKGNVDGVIIRVGHGNDSTSQDDPQAIRNMEECERLGIPYGVYLYSYALNNAEAESEAAHALRMVEGYNPVLGVWFDMEDADSYKEKHNFNPYDNRQEITDFCKIFCDRVSEAGYKTGVYASKNYWDSVIYADQLSNYEVWLAHWSISEPSMDCLLWQYTSDGEVAGVPSSRVDMNYWYGELPEVDGGSDSDSNSGDCGGDEEDTEDGGYSYSVGDTVNYDTIYVSSTSEEALKPTYTTGTITRVVDGARNPYLIDDGTGWINDDCIASGGSDDSDDSEESSDCGGISAGDTVRFNGDTDYNGTAIKAWHNDSGYEVTQLDGDRAVLSFNGSVFAAVNVNDCELI